MSLLGGLVGGLGSIIGGIEGSSAERRAARRSRRQLREAALRAFGFSGPGGIGGSFDPSTGQLNFDLGGRLTDQQGLFDSLGALFAADSFGGGVPASLQSIIGAQEGVAGAQPGSDNALFAGLQEAIGGNLGIAQQGIFSALGGVAPELADQAFGLSGNFLSELAGGSEAARSRTLGLLRDQAQPFEERAFQDLQQNLFSTGRLGTSGGALQTEAFARGLGQADLDRQLVANQEGRNFQQNAFNLGSGLFNLGAAETSLSDQLLGNAFGRFGNFAGLAADVEGQRFGQALAGQQNLFNQLDSVFRNQLGAEGFAEQTRSSNFADALRAFGFGNSLDQSILPFLNLAFQGEVARSNAALGQGQALQGLIPGAGGVQDAYSSLFAGLGQIDFGGLFGGLFGGGGSSSGGGFGGLFGGGGR